MDTNHSIFQSAKHFFLGTLCSRCSGLVRDMLMAFWFGSASEIAAFMVAYRLANLFRRLLGEGNLQAGFVPHFETLRREDPKLSFLFYRDTAFSLCLSIAILIACMMAALKFRSVDWKTSWVEMSLLAMWMAPGLLFICLSSLNSAFLRCQKKYFITAASPVFFNFIWILAAFIAHHFALKQAALILSCGVSAAFGMQWISTGWFAKKEWRLYLSWKEWFCPKLFSADWKKLIQPMALGIVGAGAIQFNSALDAIFGLMADPSGPIYLWYAIRVQQLPLALFGIALSGALLPPLSRAMQEGALQRYQDLLEIAVKRSAALMVPCTFAMFALGLTGLNLLFGRGDFSSADVQKTFVCFWGYSLGVFPSVLVMLLATGCYAKKSYGLPAGASVAAVLFNTALNGLMVFVFHWGVLSIALATSLSAFLNSVILARKLPRSFWLFLLRLTSASGIAAMATLFLGSVWLHDATLEVCKGHAAPLSRAFSEQLLQLIGMTVLFLGSFFVSARAVGLSKIFSFIHKREEETSSAES